MEQNSFHYEANIKANSGFFQPVDLAEATIDSMHFLQPMVVDWKQSDGSITNTLFLIDFVRERIYNIEGRLLQGEVAEKVLNIIRRKKSNNLPPIPTEVVEETINRKNSAWKNNHARKIESED